MHFSTVYVVMAGRVDARIRAGTKHLPYCYSARWYTLFSGTGTDNIKNAHDERVNLAIITANNHYAGFGPGTANIFRNMMGLHQSDKTRKRRRDAWKLWLPLVFQIVHFTNSSFCAIY